MESFALAFPILFIFHDLEEIVGMRIFLDRNAEMLQKRFPKIFYHLNGATNEGFALAVMEEFVLFTLIALAALWFNNQLFWNIWLGAFSGVTFHYLVHLGQMLVLRKYIPAVATSIICLPISVYIIYQCFMILSGDGWVNVWQMLSGVAIVAGNFFLAHKLTFVKF